MLSFYSVTNGVDSSWPSGNKLIESQAKTASHILKRVSQDRFDWSFSLGNTKNWSCQAGKITCCVWASASSWFGSFPRQEIQPCYMSGKQTCTMICLQSIVLDRSFCAWGTITFQRSESGSFDNMLTLKNLLTRFVPKLEMLPICQSRSANALSHWC